jgi:hypothetical protein
MTMKRKGGVVNGLHFNNQLTVNPSVFRHLQRRINQCSGFLRRAGAASEAAYMPVVRRSLAAPKEKASELSRDSYVEPYGRPLGTTEFVHVYDERPRSPRHQGQEFGRSSSRGAGSLRLHGEGHLPGAPEKTIAHPAIMRGNRVCAGDARDHGHRRLPTAEHHRRAPIQWAAHAVG